MAREWRRRRVKKGVGLIATELLRRGGV